MAEPEVIIDEEDGADVEMDNGEEVVETVAPGAEDGDETGLENIETETPERLGFIDYLKSPIIEVVVGTGEKQTVLHAHQALLVQSPFLNDLVNAFSDDSTRRRIELANEDLTATAAVLEYLYKQDYFPSLSGGRIEPDPSIIQPDAEGLGLLRHARVYTLAQRFGLPSLAGLAHKKIHLSESTAQGEIAYARYVYGNTQTTDINIRKPIAQFWATRSHILRHEAEKEFRSMCLEYPQFGFDVLSLVLDAQEKRTHRQEAGSQASGTGRKRARMSQG